MKKDIYVITNIVTNQLYVGQSKDANKRFTTHKLAKDNTLLHKAMREFGPQNFKMRILESQVEDFNEKEQYWIEELDTLYPKGYNMTKGGEGYPHMNGELCYQSKLSDIQAEEIRGLLKNSQLSQEKIGEKYNVGQSIISNINLGKTYFSKSWEYPIRSFDEVHEKYEKIKIALENTSDSLQKIADQFNTHKSTVNRINQGLVAVDKDRIYPIRSGEGRHGKLDSQEILLKIKDLLENSRYTTYEIATIFGVQRAAIEKINQGKSYHNDDWDYPLRKVRRSPYDLTDEELSLVVNLLKNSDMSIRAIGRKVNRTHGVISNINYGLTKRYYDPNLDYPIRHK